MSYPRGLIGACQWCLLSGGALRHCRTFLIILLCAVVRLVRFLLNFRTAWRTGNYRAVANLLRSMPNVTGYVRGAVVPRAATSIAIGPCIDACAVLM